MYDGSFLMIFFLRKFQGGLRDDRASGESRPRGLPGRTGSRGGRICTFFLNHPFLHAKIVLDASPGLFLDARFDFWDGFNVFLYILGGFLGGAEPGPCSGAPRSRAAAPDIFKGTTAAVRFLCRDPLRPEGPLLYGQGRVPWPRAMAKGHS